MKAQKCDTVKYLFFVTFRQIQSLYRNIENNYTDMYPFQILLHCCCLLFLPIPPPLRLLAGCTVSLSCSRCLFVLCLWSVRLFLQCCRSLLTDRRTARCHLRAAVTEHTTKVNLLVHLLKKCPKGAGSFLHIKAKQVWVRRLKTTFCIYLDYLCAILH